MHSTGLLAYLKYGIGSPKFGFMFPDQADQDVFIEATTARKEDSAEYQILKRSLRKNSGEQ
jgi:hypothetical protein